MSGQFLPALVLCKLLLAVYLESRRMEVYQLIEHGAALRLTRRHQACRTVCAGSLPAPWSVDTQHDLHNQEHRQRRVKQPTHSAWWKRAGMITSKVRSRSLHVQGNFRKPAETSSLNSPNEKFPANFSPLGDQRFVNNDPYSYRVFAYSPRLTTASVENAFSTSRSYTINTDHDDDSYWKTITSWGKKHAFDCSVFDGKREKKKRATLPSFGYDSVIWNSNIEWNGRMRLFWDTLQHLLTIRKHMETIFIIYKYYLEFFSTIFLQYSTFVATTNTFSN